MGILFFFYFLPKKESGLLGLLYVMIIHSVICAYRHAVATAIWFVYGLFGFGFGFGFGDQKKAIKKGFFFLKF